MDFIDFNSYGDMIGASIVAERNERCVNEIFIGNSADPCQLSKVLRDANDYSTSRLISDSLDSEMVGVDGDENMKERTKHGGTVAADREVDLMCENVSREGGLENLDKVVGPGTAGSHGVSGVGEEISEQEEVGMKIEVGCNSLETANLFVQLHKADESVSLVGPGTAGSHGVSSVGEEISEHKEVGMNTEVDCNSLETSNLFFQLPKAGERLSLFVDLDLCDMDEEKVMCDDLFSNQGADLSNGFTELMDPLYVKSTTNFSKEEGRNANVGEISKDATIKPREDEHKNGLLIPEKHGREKQTVKGEYFVSDLVWGKVRSHPWWPGQILDSSSASDKAMKYFKKGSYLIGYFGDQTFAWNDASNLRPFGIYFSEMENQSRAEAFRTAVDSALDEVSRRVEFGLVCGCLPEAVLDRVVSRAATQGQSSRIYGGDNLSAATLFVPAELPDYLKLLAEAPKAVVNRLQFTTARSQLLAFKRWKGFYELPAIEEFTGIAENDADQIVLHEEKKIDGVLQVLPGSNKCDALAENGMFFTKGTSCKRKNLAAGGQRKKRQHVMELMPTISSCFSNGEKTFQEENNGNMASESFDQAASQPGKHIYVRKQVAGKLEKSSSFMCSDRSSQRAALNNGGKPLMVSRPLLSTLSKGKPRRRRSTPQEYPPVDEMLSKMIIVAETPMETCTLLESIAGFFFTFRNSICLENNSLLRNEESAGKINTEDVSELISVEVLEGTEDSYWADRMIQNNLKDQVLLEQDTLTDEPERLNLVNPQKDVMTPTNLEEPEVFESETPVEKTTLIAEPQGLDLVNVNKDDDSHTTATITDADTQNLPHVDENSDEYSPTLLILNFNKLESIPSIPNLNKIFTHYGPLHELDTEILSKSKRAKMFFKRRSDADAAFSSAGKYSIFGPSLISYRLKYLPKTYKASSASKTKRRRKNATAAIQSGM